MVYVLLGYILLVRNALAMLSSYSVYKYPYLLSFTDDAIEIRTTSNGSLVKNIGAPNLHLISFKVNFIFIYSIIISFICSIIH